MPRLPKKRKKSKVQFYSWYTVILLALIVVVFLGHALFLKPLKPINSNESELSVFRLKLAEPMSPYGVMVQLKDQKINVQTLTALPIILAVRLIGRPHAGLYELNSQSTLFNLIQKLIKGDTLKAKITFIEGWPIWRLKEAINNHPDLVHKTLNWNEEQLLKELGASEINLEGLFFPSTYIFEPGSEDIQIYRIAYKTLKNKLNNVWEKVGKNTYLKNSYELLILASLIEKESGASSDRKRISSVFHNRLSKDMRLQTDPSVIYGIGEKFNGNLTKKDLKTDSRYNTYTRRGLPPTPISAVSMDSLLAAANPENTDFYYFVADGKGGSIFSQSLTDHERAVDKFQRRRAKN